MTPLSNSLSERPKPYASGEISAAALQSLLAGHAPKALVFHYDGRDVLPGYHVTEVKTGIFESLDCGASFEKWHETFIQLWDLPAKDGQTFMTVAKFLAIIRKVPQRVPFDPNARLTFEVSDGTRAMQLYRATSVETKADTVRVALTQRPTSCKPRDRWLEHESVPQAPCCGASSTQSNASSPSSTAGTRC